MADIPNPNPVDSPLGTPFDRPATAEDLAEGQPGVTIFSLLKGILLALEAIRDNPS